MVSSAFIQAPAVYRSASEPAKFSTSKKVWLVSVLALAAASAVDLHSSWGGLEANRTLAGPDGRFGVKGAALKVSFASALVGVQWLAGRKHPGTYKAGALVNFVMSGVYGGVAARNYGIKNQQ